MNPNAPNTTRNNAELPLTRYIPQNTPPTIARITPKRTKMGVKTRPAMLKDPEEEEDDDVDAATGVRKTWIPVPGSRNLENLSAIVDTVVAPGRAKEIER